MSQKNIAQKNKLEKGEKLHKSANMKRKTCMILRMIKKGKPLVIS